MTLLYFAWVLPLVGKSEETLNLPDSVRDVRGMNKHLAARGAGYAEALSDERRIRVAVNQTHSGFDTALHDGDEIAFFPPVTGG